ncbi:MAG TPA: hypothetical protein VHV10_19010 [Ktedonobacteraceae bacterium]|nr:hypothetical protein [Ktedonobacteraceae bacterium]
MADLEKRLTSSGAKAHQRRDIENRILPYSLWHRTLDRSLLMLDVDFIKWRFRDGELVPVGVMEVTRVDSGKDVNENYLNSILQRYDIRDLQGKIARKVAEALKTRAYIVLFRENCSEFWVYDLTYSRGWIHFDPKEMRAFLKRLT